MSQGKGPLTDWAEVSGQSGEGPHAHTPAVFSKYGARPSWAAATDLRPAVFKDFERFGHWEAAAPEDGRAPIVLPCNMTGGSGYGIIPTMHDLIRRRGKMADGKCASRKTRVEGKRADRTSARQGRPPSAVLRR